MCVLLINSSLKKFIKSNTNLFAIQINVNFSSVSHQTCTHVSISRWLTYIRSILIQVPKRIKHLTTFLSRKKRWTKRDIHSTTIQFSLSNQLKQISTNNVRSKWVWKRGVHANCVRLWSSHFNHSSNMPKKIVNDNQFWQFDRCISVKQVN